MSKFNKLAKKFYKDWYSGGPYETIQGTRSGFRDLDLVTGGFRPGELILVASRPAMGKTSLVLNMIDKISVRDNCKSLYLTNECSEKVIADRLIQIHAGVSGISFNKFEFYDEEEMALDTEKKLLTHAKVDIKNITGIPITGIDEVLKEIYFKHSIDLLVIDNFKMLKDADNSEDKVILQELKRIAENYHVPIIVHCSLSRDVELRDDHHPLLSDVEIKDAIVLSDFVFFLYRDNYYNPTEESTVPLEIDIVKNPRGRRGIVVLKTYRDCFTMADYPGDKILDMRKKYEENHFCHILDRWEEVIKSLEFSLTDESEFDTYISPLELQTVGGNPATLTVIIPDAMDSCFYSKKYGGMLMQAVLEVTELKCQDIYFVTKNEMEEFYKECEKDEKRWS